MGCINQKHEIKSDVEISQVNKTNKITESNINSIIETNEKTSTNIKKSDITLNSMIINYPKLICKLKNIENNIEKEIVITPNSLNGKIIKDLEGKIYINEFDNLNYENLYIYFDKEKENFYIENKSKYGLYKKINKKIKLENNLIIAFSIYHIYIKKKEKNKIKITCVEDQNNIIYTEILNNDKEITIGRNLNCIVHLDNENISRIQMSLLFENENWYIYDGYNEKESLNGIWLNFINNKMKIENSNIIKIGKLIIIIEYNEN
jgi:hypothetical protein